MKLNKFKVYAASAKAVWDNLYRFEKGDKPTRAYQATKKTAIIFYDLELKRKIKKVKEFFSEKG